MKPAIKAAHKRKHLFISIVFRVLVNFFITFAIIAILQSVWYFTITLSFAVKQVSSTRTELLTALKNGLAPSEVLQLAKTGQPNADGFSDDPRYTELLDWLDTIHQVSPSSWPFVFVPGDEGRVVNVVDLNSRYQPELSRDFLESIPFDTSDDIRIAEDVYWHMNGNSLNKDLPEIPAQIDQLIKDNEYTDQIISQINLNLDSLGNWVSIYSFIRDENGQVVAGVGMDIENSLVSTLGNEILKQLGISFIGTMLIMMLMGMRLGTVFTKPIVRLTRAAEIINTGDHEEGLKKLEQAGSRGPFRNEVDQLVETISRLVNFQHALYTISATANTSNDQNELFNQTYREVSDLFEADQFSIALFEPEKKIIHLTRMNPGSCQTCPAEQMEYVLATPPDLIGQVILTGQSLNLTNKTYAAYVASTPIKEEGRFTAWLGVPMKWGEESIGVLVVQTCADKTVFSENDKALLEFIANQLSMILKRNKAENELRQSYQLLEQRVYDRTIDLQQANSKLIKEIVEREHAEAEMIKAKEAAEAANVAKSVFLANMSHELRTPLNAILGFSNLMAHDPNMPNHHKEDLVIIQQSGEHLLDLINDVLELSKIEAGRNTLNPVSFDLHQLLHEVEEVFQSRAGERGLSLIFNTDEAELPQFIHGDEKKLRQIFLNLLSNAVKFTESGGVTLRGRVIERMADEQVRLGFEIEDTGQGILQDQIKDLFDYFVQTDAGKKSQEGTGLGLSITRTFIQMMGGSIQVTSELGKGSLFSFDIVVELSDGTDIEAAPKHQKVIGIEPDQSNKRILVVEDREANRKLLVKLLEPFSSKSGSGGLEIREAVNGKEALLIWEEWSPDLIFMDMRMPEMNGHEATRRIREQVKGDSTVIIALTASAFEEDRKLILSEGINDFIRKPFKEHEIFEALKKYLGMRFIYAEDHPRGAQHDDLAEAAASGVVRELQLISGDWKAELQQAASAADGEHIHQSIGQMREEHKQLAGVLEGLAAQYRFDLILSLLSK